jgi:hypothetical protein
VLTLANENGEPGISLFVLKVGPGLHLFDENFKTRAVLGVDVKGPRLALADPNENVIWQAPP